MALPVDLETRQRDFDLFAAEQGCDDELTTAPATSELWAQGEAEELAESSAATTGARRATPPRPQPKESTRVCTRCGMPLSAIGHARKNGANHADWHSRHMHKACWKAMQPANPRRNKFLKKKRRF